MHIACWYIINSQPTLSLTFYFAHWPHRKIQNEIFLPRFQKPGSGNSFQALIVTNLLWKWGKHSQRCFNVQICYCWHANHLSITFLLLLKRVVSTVQHYESLQSKCPTNDLDDVLWVESLNKGTLDDAQSHYSVLRFLELHSKVCAHQSIDIDIVSTETSLGV